MLEAVTRVPPHNLEAEQAVIASLMVDADAVLRVRPLLKAESFYREAHATIYAAVLRLVDRAAPVDLITLRDELGHALDDVGGYGYLVDLSCSLPTTAHAEHYARLVADKARLRGLIVAADAAQRSAFDGATADDVSNDLTSAINRLDVADARTPDEGWSYFEAVEARKDAGRSGNLDVGIYDLDQRMTMTRGELVMLAARPAMGKTAACLAMAWGVAKYAPVLLYTLEMQRDRLADRLALALHDNLSGRALERGELDSAGWQAVVDTQVALRDSGLRIIKPRKLTVEDVRRDVLRAEARGELPALVVIDYLGLMDLPKSDRHDLALTEVTRQLKQMATEVGCVVLLLAQLSRACESRPNKRPLLSDLKDSGGIEANADKVIFLYRDDYYAALEGRASTKPELCEFIVAKYRTGDPCIVDLKFNRAHQRFTSPGFQPWAN